MKLLISEEIVGPFGGVVVKPYFWPDDRDREMRSVYEQLTEIARHHRNGK
jgi:hypothetical protein